jgi:hypothetical protein
MPTSTARVDFVAGVSSMMTAYIAANPTLLMRHYRTLPAQFQDLPATYLDITSEQIHHAQGLRDRVMSSSIVLVTRLTDSAETTDVHSILVDSLVDWFTSYPHIVAGTVWSDMTVATEAAGEDNQFLATRFSLPDYTVKEPRT